mgnify:CR=1 FL=1
MRIALTSVPPRFPQLGPHLEELLAQRPEGITLSIPHRYARFPDWRGPLPKLPAGVDLLRAPDAGPATKFVAALARDADIDILLCDDDCRYLPGWLATFRAARAAHPERAVAAGSFDTGRLGLPAGHRIAQGFAGVLLRGCWLPNRALEPDDEARWVDDIWLSAHLAAAGRRIVPCPEARVYVVPENTPDPLQSAVVNGADRATLNRRVAHRLQRDLGIWR